MRKSLLMRYCVVTVVLAFFCLSAGQLLSGQTPQDTQVPLLRFVTADPADVELEPETLKIFTDKTRALVENGLLLPWETQRNPRTRKPMRRAADRVFSSDLSWCSASATGTG